MINEAKDSVLEEIEECLRRIEELALEISWEIDLSEIVDELSAELHRRAQRHIL